MTDHYHIVGVAGVGMRALAELLLGMGHAVTGSDRFHDQGRTMQVLLELQALGLDLVPQDGSGVGEATKGVVVSTAIEPGNPDTDRAQALSIPVLHRTELIAQLIGESPLLAVTGTAGKTTVTGMIGWIMDEAGLAPTVLNGGSVNGWSEGGRLGCARAGKGGPWVLEADESDRSLLRFHPDVSVITNISADHFGEEETVALFEAFAGQTRKTVLCGEGVKPMLSKEGIAADIVEVSAERTDQGTFVVDGEAYRIRLVGEHNRSNAILAVAACRAWGVEAPAIREALERFTGVRRRLEAVGEAGGVTVIDDYAHNPAKIRAAWEAVSANAERVLGAWRPHGFKPLESMMDDLVSTWAEVCGPDDRIFILPVYFAGGTVSRSVRSDDLVEQLQDRGVRAELVEDFAKLSASLAAEARTGDVILSMGARDPDLPLFARDLSARLRDSLPQR